MTFSAWIVSALGVGVASLLIIIVYEQILRKILQHYNIIRRVFEYFRNKKEFEKWLKEKETQNDGDEERT